MFLNHMELDLSTSPGFPRAPEYTQAHLSPTQLPSIPDKNPLLVRLLASPVLLTGQVCPPSPYAKPAHLL